MRADRHSPLNCDEPYKNVTNEYWGSQARALIRRAVEDLVDEHSSTCGHMTIAQRSFPCNLGSKLEARTVHRQHTSWPWE
jgi:hypothetical protein